MVEKFVHNIQCIFVVVALFLFLCFVCLFYATQDCRPARQTNTTDYTDPYVPYKDTNACIILLFMGHSVFFTSIIARFLTSETRKKSRPNLKNGVHYSAAETSVQRRLVLLLLLSFLFCVRMSTCICLGTRQDKVTVHPWKVHTQCTNHCFASRNFTFADAKVLPSNRYTLKPQTPPSSFPFLFK